MVDEKIRLRGSDKGLRADSIGLISTMALGLASAAPAYSLTVTLGLVVLLVGVHAPAALLVGFVPILCTAFAFRELNREMPDCGTNFVWITRAFGPWPGWLIGNWVTQVTTIIAMTALARVGAGSLLGLLGVTAPGTPLITVTGIAILGLVTLVAYRGVGLSAAVQIGMLVIQFAAIAIFGFAALRSGGGATPSAAWFNPFELAGTGHFTEAVLLCLFIYWGWDAALCVNEEARDRTRTPGLAAVLSTIVLLVTYLFTAVAVLSFTGADGLGSADEAADILASLAPALLDSPLTELVQLAVCLSAIGALLTCVVSLARPNLSVAAHGAAPKIFGRIHPRFRTPSFATLFIGATAALLLTALTLASPAFLGDAILSIALLISFYYGGVAFACVWYFRGRLRNSALDLLTKGVLPAAGGLMMLFAFLRSAYDMLDTSYGSLSLGGVGGVFLLGIGSILLGALVTGVVRVFFPAFFRDGKHAITDLIITEN
ncbi:MAG: amino acid transporter [Nocardia sp.]|uniref:APC family permease n=1 Tax=Nocardia sp. TaxID=1821 RepID=UPI00260C7D2A|nr:APC family permease [Nocardia sp.]MCU1642545.1 amino acid transporter [Nocardia sp.]